MREHMVRKFHAFPLPQRLHKLLFGFSILSHPPFFFIYLGFWTAFFGSVGVVIGRERRLLQRRRVRVPICRRWRAVFLCCRGALRVSRWRILRLGLEGRVSLAAQWRKWFWDVFFALCGLWRRRGRMGNVVAYTQRWHRRDNSLGRSHNIYISSYRYRTASSVCCRPRALRPQWL